MKRLYQYISILIGASITLGMQAQNDQNFVRVRTYTKATTVVDDPGKGLDNIQYFDGLGRPIQTVQRNITPNMKDLANYQQYDPAGRKSNAWMPSVSPSNGLFIPLSTIEQNALSQYQDSAYNRPVYEASPLNRIKEQYGPGKQWYEKEQSVKTEYFTNNDTAGELSCMLFTVKNEGLNTTLEKTGYYNAGELYVTKITSEKVNEKVADGATGDDKVNVTYEFKDKLGQVVLTRQINSGEVLDTYYVYDDFSNRSFVLPPILSSKVKTINGIVSQTDLDLYAYQYKYNQRNLCIQKQLPGAKPISYVYDKADQLIFLQDGEQKKKNEWMFAFMDAFGRGVISGICKDITVTNSIYNDLLIVAEAKDGGTYRGYNILINGQPTILPSATIMAVNYYDNYNFLGKYTIPNWENTPKDGYGKRIAQTNGYETKGLLTGTSTALLDGSDKYQHTVTYYDNRGRIIQAIASNHLDGEDKTWLAYDYTNQPVSQLHEHIVKIEGLATKQTELTTNYYDHAGRLIETRHKLNNGREVVLAKNKYNELGQLESATALNKPELKTSYTYNVRSWIKSIDNTKFKENLDYTYSGNIKEMVWKQNTDTKDRSYTFEYDKLSQLASAKYAGNSGQDYSTSYSYDMHGNIKTLNRKGLMPASGAYGDFDKLTMEHNGNQLLWVEDQMKDIKDNELADFKDYAHQSVEYAYNDNGAMVMDLNKGIQNIDYNYLNLPSQVSISHASAQAKNTYLYTASGIKLRVKHEDVSSLRSAPVGGTQESAEEKDKNLTVDYIGNKIYENGMLDKILLANGYIEDGKYYIYDRDHLGNNRLVTDDGGNVIQSTHYYPFGMAFAESTGGEKQPYKYNNKELDGMYELNWYDYSARMKDDWGFTTMDPHSEKYYSWSPYAYCGNNPMLLTDPTGMDWVQRMVGGFQEIYYDRNVRSQDDVNVKYGSDGGVTHIANGTAYSATDKNGNLVAYYQFWNDASDNNAYGAITDAKGNLYADDKIIYGNKYTIFGTTDNNVDASTLYKNLNYKNLLGNNSYTGGKNPATYGGNYSYEYIPKNLSEYPPMGHDKDYDAMGLAGLSGVFGSTLAWKADLRLAANSSNVTTINILNGNLSDATRSAAISVAFGAIGVVKTALHPITIGVNYFNNFDQKRGEAALNSTSQVATPYAPF